MQPVTRRKPAPKTTDVAFREQGPWSGKGDHGKLAGGGENMRKEGSCPPTALIIARAGSLGPRWSARFPLPAAGVHPCLALAALLTLPQRRAFPQLSPRQHSLGPFSLTCLPHRNLGQAVTALWRALQGWDGVWLPLNLPFCQMPGDSGRSSFQDQLQLCRPCPTSKGRSCSLGLCLLRTHVCSPGSSFLCDSR